MKRRRLEADSSSADISHLPPSVGKGGKKSKPAQTDKDFEEYQKVMELRTRKGPSWANELQIRPQTSVNKAEGIGPEEGQIDINPTPSQVALSDLEWMRQRMVKPTVGDSDTAPRHLPVDDVDINEVRSHEVICPARRHLTQL